MTTMDMQSWQSLRYELNHDLLNNRLRNQLLSFSQLTNALASDMPALKNFLGREGQYRALISQFEDVFDPAQMLDWGELGDWPAQAKMAVREFARSYYIEHSGLRGVVEEARNSVDRAFIAARAAQTSEKLDRTELSKLLAVTADLSAAISGLPQEPLAGRHQVWRLKAVP